jgi:hypothetical protein
MDRAYGEHGLTERRRQRPLGASRLLISLAGMAHLPQCPHRGDDPDYSRWAEFDASRAWERLGVPAAQAARFGYAAGWLGRLLSAFAE